MQRGATYEQRDYAAIITWEHNKDAGKRNSSLLWRELLLKEVLQCRKKGKTDGEC